MDSSRFWSKIEKRGPEDCWPCVNVPCANGYVYIGRPKRLAHRVAFEFTKGPIPKGLVVMHLCNKRNCCNPAHLQAATQQENMNWPGGKSMGGRGSKHGLTHFIEQDILDIRKNAWMGPRMLGRKYRVSHGTICAILARKTWREVS